MSESVTRQSYIAGADLSAKQYYAVRLISADTVNVGTLGSKCVGVLVNTPSSGHAAEVATAGKVKMIAGSAITAGDTVESDASGKAHKKTGDGYALGVAITGAATGALFDVQLMPGQESSGLARMTAGADLSAAAKLAVKVGSADDEVVKGTLGSDCVGIVVTGAAAAAEVVVQTSGVATATSGAAVTLGAELICNAAGKVIDNPGTAGYFVLGTALNDTAGADADVHVLLTQRGANPTVQTKVQTTLIAGAGGTTAKTFVKAGTVAGRVDTCGAGDAAIGVCATTDAGGGNVIVQMAGIASVTTGGIVAAGAALMADAAGLAVTYVASADNHLIGYALSADGAGGGDINVAIVPMGWEQDLPSQLTTELIAEAAGVTAKLFVTANTVAGECKAITSSGQRAIGVSLDTAAVGVSATVQFAGVVTCTSGAAVTAGDTVQANVVGRAITASGIKGHYALGVALSTAGGAGVDLTVLLLPAWVQDGTSARVIKANAFIGMDTNWTIDELGHAALPASQTNEYLLIAIPGLRVGDVITGYRLLGALNSGGNAVTVDGKLVSLAKAAGATPTRVEESVMVQVSKTAAYALDDGATGLAVTVGADKTYHLWVQCTTAAATTAAISGAEIDVTEQA
jgi:hypothetical protein